MHFVGTKKKVIQSTSALPLLNRKKKELITTACEQLSSTEGAPTVTISDVSLRSSLDLELTAGREIFIKPEFLPCLKNLTQKRKEDRTKRKEISLSTIELHFYIQIGTGFERLWILLRAGSHSTFTFHIRNVDLHFISNFIFRNPCSCLGSYSHGPLIRIRRKTPYLKHN